MADDDLPKLVERMVLQAETNLVDDDGNKLTFTDTNVMDGAQCQQYSGAVQDFNSLRAECLAAGRLFEDPEFLAADSSLFYSKKPDKSFVWKRPSELTTNPKLFVDGGSRFDIQQGKLGNCWLLAATANITLKQKLFQQVVPDDQSFTDKYAGIFHFRFWQYGRWTDVVIDDRLPTYFGKLVYLHSGDTNEFWSPLLEKAYAKLNGTYEALDGGTTCEGMEDLTGGVSEFHDLSKMDKPNQEVFKIMQKAHQRGSLMGCSLQPDPKVREAKCPDGLVKGHTYSVTSVQKVKLAKGKQKLVRLRNPWGRTEWTGDWCDSSVKWNEVDEEEKKKISLNKKSDGEFWMPFNDFCVRFDEVEMTHLCPESGVEVDSPLNWELNVFMGEWVKGSSAGGARTMKETFWRNPQYRITLSEADEECDDPEDDCKCTLIVALMQKNRRSLKSKGLGLNFIGFAIYHLPDPDSAPRPLDRSFFDNKKNKHVGHSDSFTNLRAISKRLNLSPGTYCIIPSTYHVGEEGEFILRVFTEKKNTMVENDTQIQIDVVDSRAAVSAEADPRVAAFFDKLAGEDKGIDWKELQDFLNHALKKEINNEELDKKVCRSLIKTISEDENSKLNLSEFGKLWADIMTWKNAFRLYDGGSGQLSGFELREVLKCAGYKVNNKVTDAFMQNYSDAEGNLAFIDYFTCCVNLKAAMGLGDGKARQKCLEDLKRKD